MKIVVLDCEANGLTPTKVWCICTEEVSGEEKFYWDDSCGFDCFITYAKTVDYWVMHNGIHYDGPVLNKLIQEGVIDEQKIIDTFIVSKTVDYYAFNTHSLAEWGVKLGVPKQEHDDWDNYSPEMLSRCRSDVDITRRVWDKLKRYVFDPKWAMALRTEHDIAIELRLAQDEGFDFDKDTAKDILEEVKYDMLSLEAEFQKAWPPTLEEVKRIKLRTKEDGTLYKNVQDAMLNHPYIKQANGAENEEFLILYDYIPFKPGSPKVRVDKLWKYGWSPIEKTKGHKKFLKERKPDPVRKAHFDRYGWTCGEVNLATLPDDAPEVAHKLAEWLTLEGRRSSLEEWIGCVDPIDGKIHGKTWHIGTWTGRMSHTKPNTANIASVWGDDEPTNGVERVKAKYDNQLRALFHVKEGEWLVGTDAEGIQLRVLAHYLKDEGYADSIANGVTADGTDIHNVNRRALGLESVTRPQAKTFIYAWLLGAGVGMVRSILRCSTSLATAAISSFLNNTPGLKRLKEVEIPRDARRGYFVGLDGRRVKNNSEYLMLAGYLQNGESIAIKMWTVLKMRMAREAGLNVKLLAVVHDETQTKVVGSYEDAAMFASLEAGAMHEVSKKLGMFCPLTVSSNIGVNWKETH